MERKFIKLEKTLLKILKNYSDDEGGSKDNINLLKLLPEVPTDPIFPSVPTDPIFPSVPTGPVVQTRGRTLVGPISDSKGGSLKRKYLNKLKKIKKLCQKKRKKSR